MFTLLEFLFQGFLEWVYGLILEIWNYFSSSLLSVMSLDFAYIKTHIPIVADSSQVLLAVGWALLLGNLIFQALRSMASGLGFEGEDPKLLFARTFIFGFLLLASPQICETVLGITSSVIALIEIPDAINVQLVDGSAFGVFTASWILVIIFDLITMFMVLSLLLEVAERYMVLAVLTIMAPLAFAMGGSKSTSEIFTGWCRMFGSMCFLMAANIVFFKILLSVVSTVPSFPDVFLWMILIVSIVKVAKKADEIITRIGLNPAITGNQSTLPGMLAYTVFRTTLSMATKGAATGIGGALGLAGKAAADAGKGAAGAVFKRTDRAAGTSAGGAGVAGTGSQKSDRPRYGGGRKQAQQLDSQQEYTRQSRHTQQQNISQAQTSSQQQATTQERTVGTFQAEKSGAAQRPGMPQHEHSFRRLSVPRGAQRTPSYITYSQARAEKASISSRTTTERSSGGTSIQKIETAQPGMAGTGIHSVRQPSVPEPRHSKNLPPTASTLATGTQRSSPVQQKPHQTTAAGKPPAKDRDAAPHSGTAGTDTRSTRRPAVSEPQHSRNIPPAASMPPFKTQRSGSVQQESRQSAAKDKPTVKGGGPVPRPGSAGTGGGPRTPPGQKPSGRPAVQNPARQTHRKGGPNHV